MLYGRPEKEGADGNKGFLCPQVALVGGASKAIELGRQIECRSASRPLALRAISFRFSVKIATLPLSSMSPLPIDPVWLYSVRELVPFPQAFSLAEPGACSEQQDAHFS